MTVPLNLLLICIAASGARTAGQPGFSIELNFSLPHIREIDDATFLEAEGLRHRFVPGEPILPVRTLFVPVPPGVYPDLEFSVLSGSALHLPSGIMRTPAVLGEGLETRYESVEEIAGPSENVVLRGVIPLAGSRVAIVDVFPALGNAPSFWATDIRIQLSWPVVSGALPIPEGHPLGKVTGHNALYWPTSTGERAESYFWGKPWARLSIGETGAYSVLGSELEDHGCAVTGTPVQSLAMFTGPGREFSSVPETGHSLSEVSIIVDDVDSDGLFDAEDRIRFMARSLDRWEYSDPQILEWICNRYATHNVYWLTWGGAAGTRITELPAPPDGSPSWGPLFSGHDWFEENHTWLPSYETRTGWTWMSTGPGGSMSMSFDTEEVYGPGSIEIMLIPTVGGNNLVTVSLNGTQVGTDSWYGAGPHMMVVSSLDLDTHNTLEIFFAEGGFESLLELDYVHVEYERGTGDTGGSALYPGLMATGRFLFDLSGLDPGSRIFDLTDFSAPVEFTDMERTADAVSFACSISQYSVLMSVNPDDWNTPDSIGSASPGRLVGSISEGDRLIVTPPGFWSGVWGLAAIQEESGHIPVVATTREIYDEFGQGVADPGAIRSMVRWGIDSWTPGLAGVILAGDGHYDYLGNTTSQPVLVPPWIGLGSGGGGDCFDDYFVMTHAGSVLPEIPIARIPADNSTELGTCTAKSIAYRPGESDGTWMNRCLIVADDDWGQNEHWNETAHTNQCELIAEEALPRHVDRYKFFLIEYPWPPGTPSGPHPDKPDARADLIDLFSEGMGAFIYIGHGSAGQIAHEKILLSSDIDLLANGSRLPLSIWATCDVGQFDNPGTDAIAEDLINTPQGGSIAAIAATRGCYSVANYELGRAILDSLYSMQDLTMGEALWLAKISESGSYHYNNRFYVLFGYPDFVLPSTDHGAVVSIEGDTLRSGEINSISGSGFPPEGLAMIEIRESSTPASYTCLGGAVIEYLKYGGSAFRGSIPVELGQFEMGCIIPLQADTGSWARVVATSIGSSDISTGAVDPAQLVTGTPSGDDFTGPAIAMWIRGYEGVEEPVVSGDVILEADLEDSSGICFLGGEGRQLRLFVNGESRDVGRWFSYNQGSTTKGRLSYELSDLAAGSYTLILSAQDGVGNHSLDTLLLETLDADEISITETIVYPNPGSGRRCFSFRLSAAASVSVTIYTVSGRRIQSLSLFCGQGYNQIIWDGLDADGDAPASGSYIYRLLATAEGSSVFENQVDSIGVLAIVRE